MKDGATKVYEAFAVDAISRTCISPYKGIYLHRTFSFTLVQGSDLVKKDTRLLTNYHEFLAIAALHSARVSDTRNVFVLTPDGRRQQKAFVLATREVLVQVSTRRSL